MRLKLSTPETTFEYQNGTWQFIENKHTLFKKQSSNGTVLAGTLMDIVPLGKALYVGLRVTQIATGAVLAIFPLGRGDQAKALTIAGDWNARASSMAPHHIVPAADPSAQASVGRQLLDLVELRDRGELTEAEFQAQRARVLGTN
jgi:hypothetical protein